MNPSGKHHPKPGFPFVPASRLEDDLGDLRESAVTLLVLQHHWVSKWMAARDARVRAVLAAEWAALSGQLA